MNNNDGKNIGSEHESELSTEGLQCGNFALEFHISAVSCSTLLKMKHSHQHGDINGYNSHYDQYT